MRVFDVAWERFSKSGRKTGEGFDRIEAESSDKAREKFGSYAPIYKPFSAGYDIVNIVECGIIKGSNIEIVR